MEQQKVDMYLITNQKYFPTEKIVYLKDKLLSVDDQRFSMLSAVSLQDPSILLVVSIIVGSWGFDRFLLGDVGMGILKLLTGGLCGILTIYDWITVMGRTKEDNFQKIMTVL